MAQSFVDFPPMQSPALDCARLSSDRALTSITDDGELPITPRGRRHLQHRTSK
jgi:hypothetical protein